MADRLYPPYIEGTIPAFYGTVGTNTQETEYRLTVPFSMNKGVGLGDIAGFRVKMKNVQSNNIILEKTYYSQNIEVTKNIIDTGQIVCTFTNSDLAAGAETLELGQFFKVQLAYVNHSGDPGYFSTVGVTKYTSKPVISIKGLLGNRINSHTFSYTGEYSQITTQTDKRDSTEKLYSSKFIIYDSNDKIVEESEEIIHNITKDSIPHQAVEEWRHGRSLQMNESYFIQWVVTTSNNMVVSTMKYRIMDKESIAPHIKADLIAVPNFDNGYVDLKLKGHLNGEGQEIPSSGLFLLSRRDEDNNGRWEELYRFALFAERPSREVLFRDFTIKQGVHYTYALQQYNKEGLYSSRLLHKQEDEDGNLFDKIVYADFEDSFIFDGKRQLKIRYNVQSNSFTRNIQETATPTIGSKYPFIFRNGAVDYKSFPISGLISYYMDEENLFMSEEEFMVNEKTTNLSSENIAAEREFKMSVYEWLTNGEPKLFRSPTEGNFIVNLMNVSLSPNVQLGRMLHTFSAQATEVANCDYEGLNHYKFISIDDNNLNEVSWKSVLLSGRDDELYKWVREAVLGTQIPIRYYNTIKNTMWGTNIATQDSNAQNYFTYNNNDGKYYITDGFRERMYKVDNNGYLLKNNDGSLIEEPYGDLQESILDSIIYAGGALNDVGALSFKFSDVLPGSRFTVDGNDFIIGATGTYSQTAPVGEVFSVVSIPQNARYQGILTYSYNSSAQSDFDLVKNISIEDVPSRQFIGPVSEKIYRMDKGQLLEKQSVNIAEIIRDIKTEVDNCYKISIFKKHTVPIFVKSATANEYYYDSFCTASEKITTFDPFAIYDIRLQNTQAPHYKGEQLYYDANAAIHCPSLKKGYYDIKTQNLVFKNRISYKFWFNDETDGVDIFNSGAFIITKPEEFTRLELSEGLYAELGYQAKIIDYTIEFKSEYGVSQARVGYDRFKQDLNNLMDSLAIAVDPNVIEMINNQIAVCKVNIESAYEDLIKQLLPALEEERSVYE